MEPSTQRDDLQRAIDGGRAHLNYQTSFFGKWLKGVGWLFIVFGVLLCLTLIGIPIGFALILAGGGLIWFSRMLTRHVNNSVDAFERGANQSRTSDQGRQ